MLGVAIGACRAGRWSAGAPCAAPRDPARPAERPRARRDPARDAAQLPGAAGVLRARPTSTSSSPATSSTDHDAGLYAGGLILAKAVLFLPQFVVVVAFPSMSTAERAAPGPDRQPGRWWPRSASSCTARRAGCCSGLAMVFVGGDDVRRDRAPAVAVRRPRHGARDAAAAGLLACWPGRASARSTSSGSAVVALVVARRSLVDSLDGLLTRRARRRRGAAGRAARASA